VLREENFNNIHTMGKYPIEELQSLIRLSSLTDREIADKCGVSRGMVYRWRTGQVNSIRRGNFIAVCNSLGHKVIENQDEIKLEPLDEIIQEDPLMTSNTTTRDLIDTLTSTNKLLLEQLKYKDDALKNKDRQIKELEQHSNQPPTIELDHSRMQLVTCMDTGKFINATQPFADLIDMNALDIIRDMDQVTVTHEDDMWRMPILATIDLKELETNQTWKVKGKDVYIKISSIDICCTWRKADVMMSTHEEWLETNEWYKARDNTLT
tara:strand:+ start:48 stop:845 length:798 start_codon:yes stop_codon:yes gene_type:complete